MKKVYSQINDQERFTIDVLLKAGSTPASIARTLHRAKSTITREIGRNLSADATYEHAIAQEKVCYRHTIRAQNQKFKKLTPEVLEYTVAGLKRREFP
jgi:IS30 family transposase